MKKIRGAVALMIALGLAALAAYVVYGYLGKPRAAETAKTAFKPASEKRKEPEPPKSLARRIDPGMRAVTLMVDAVSGLSRKLVAGDRVDVAAVTPIPGETEGRISHLLMSAAEVMDVETPDKKGGRSDRSWTVTLKVTPEEASMLATADPASKLRLILRNPEDAQTDSEDSDSPAPTAFSPGRGVQAYTPQKRDLHCLISPGMRAITLDVAPTDGVGGIFRPGDRVDVVVTCPWGNLALQGNEVGDMAQMKETHRNSRIMLQNIRIIATDQSLLWDSPANNAVSQVTLEVAPADAEKLTVLADSKKGKSIIRLLSRNQEDHQQVATTGVELMDLVTKRTPYRKVDVIRGPLRKDRIFYH